jgi:hypothetical protein
VEQEGFLTDIRTAELFFRICRRYGIKGHEDRVLLMRELAKRKKAKYLRNVAPWLMGKRVLKIESKPHNPWDEHHCPDCGPRPEGLK